MTYSFYTFRGKEFQHYIRHRNTEKYAFEKSLSPVLKEKHNYITYIQMNKMTDDVN